MIIQNIGVDLQKYIGTT